MVAYRIGFQRSDPDQPIEGAVSDKGEIYRILDQNVVPVGTGIPLAFQLFLFFHGQRSPSGIPIGNLLVPEGIFIVTLLQVFIGNESIPVCYYRLSFHDAKSYTGMARQAIKHW